MSVDVTRSPAAGAPMSRAEKLQLWRQNKADAGAFASAATKKGGKSQAAAKPVKDSVVVIEKTAPAPKPATRGAKAKAAPVPVAVAAVVEAVAPAPAPVEAAPQARSKRAARGAMVPKKAAVAVPKNVELVVVEPTPAPIAAAAATPAPAAAFVPSTPAPTLAVAATNADAENTTVPGTPSFQMTASARKFGNNAANATWQPTHSKGATGKKPKAFVGVAIPPEPMVLVPAPTLMDAAGLQRALEAVQEKRLTEAGNLFAVEPLPEVKRMAKYWVARAMIEEEFSNYEGVVKLFEQATECGAQPTAELDAALRAFVGRVKNKSDTVDPKDTVAVKAFALTGLSNAVSQLSLALKAHNLFSGPAPTPMEGVATSFGASTPRGKYFGDEQPTEASYAAVVEELLADSPEPAPEKIMAKPKLARTPVGAAALIRGVTGAAEASPALFKATNKLARTPTAAPAPPVATTTTTTVTPTGRRRSSTGSAPKSPVLLSMSAAKPTTPAGDASFNAYLLGNPSLDFEEGDLPSTPECPSLALSTNSLATPANTNQSFFATPSSSRAKMAMSGGPTRVPKSLNESVAAGFEFEAHPKPSEAPKPMTAIVLLQAVRTPASMRALAEGAEEIITPVRRGTRATPKRDLTVADLETHPVYTYNKALNVEDFKDDATPSRPAKRARKSKGAASSVVDTVMEEAEAESVPTPLAATPVNTPARRSQRISRATTPA